jgi:ABC-type multidrug transport system fused ATPase/permease subunit
LYQDLLQQYTIHLARLSDEMNRIVWMRLFTAIAALVCFYLYFKLDTAWLLFLALGGMVVFFVLVRQYQKITKVVDITTALVKVNQDEITYLSGDFIPFEHGVELMPPVHAYAYDLDFFGPNSLFQHLNRTSTQLGKVQLGQNLLSLLPQEQIPDQQAAIQELTPKLNWRQSLQALAATKKDNQKTVDQLHRWVVQPSPSLPIWSIVLMWLLPIILIGAIVGYYFQPAQFLLSIASSIFSLNLLVFGLFFKRIQQEIADFDRVHEYLRQYGLLAENIENEVFTSKKILDLTAKLKNTDGMASVQITRLSELFGRLDTMANMMVVLLFDGLFLYHVHTLKSLLDWKKKHASSIPGWLQVIGTMESWSSLANFAYNNPRFAYPEMNTDYNVHFEELGHPLIRSEKRICNTVSFTEQKFIVLTGSNMSGKSTFLRSLGINMVLSGIGAPVCAKRAAVHPLPVIVSMRLSDSLSDSESYFFAEVKRLKEIMDFLGQKRAFVLLDEILRGTNSDDKRMGTVGVLKKMVAKQAIGAIATHDIEVCNTTNEYPKDLMNKCFEVEMLGDELHFDYRLRDGICQNKSASFLMGKMGII